jgi:hypothetical protein
MADLENYPCNAFRTPSYGDSDLLETNIKEIEYTLFRLMDNEKDQYFANKNSSQRISYPNGKFKYKNFILYYNKLN